VGWPPVVLFAVVFLWTPPHFWALAMRYREDYAAAGVPMLPVVVPEREVARRIVVYSWAMVAVSFLLWPVAGTGLLYPVAAGVLGGAFLFEAHRMHQGARRGVSGTQLRPMRLFHLSNTYLTLLFVAVALDPLFAG
jgi:protoheme IX farnesyltransferase